MFGEQKSFKGADKTSNNRFGNYIMFGTNMLLPSFSFWHPNYMPNEAEDGSRTIFNEELWEKRF